MAIERVAQNVDFGSAPQAGSVPINVQNATPDVNKFADGNRAVAPQPSFLDGLLTAVLPTVNKLGQQDLQNDREEAYLSGQAAAGAGLAQDQVSSNIFTRDWATAGFRDTRGRLAQADAEAQTAVDMAKLKEQSPEQFLQYLNERRQKLMPSLEGMSLEARKSFMAQQLTSDRAAIAKHAGEHQKFIIDQLGTAIQTDMSVRLDAMTKAKTDPAAYLTAADDAYSGWYGNVWNNPNLDNPSKVKLTTQAAGLALAQNHQVLYEKMRDTKLPGENYSALDRLPFDDQVKLAKSYQQSLSDTAAYRLNDYMTQKGIMEADWQNPLKPPMSYDDVKAFVDQGVQNGAIKVGDIDGIYKAWGEANEKKLTTGQLASDYATGNVGGYLGKGKTESEALTAYVQAQARGGKSAADTVGSLLQIGLQTGQTTAFKTVGDMTRSAVTSIGQNGTIDPTQLQMLTTVLGTLDQAQQKGNTTAMSAYLSSFGDADRAKIMTYREELQRTGNPQVAAANAAATAEKSSNMTDTERNVEATKKATENSKLVEALTPNSLWADFKSTVLPDAIRSKDALNQSKISASGSFFENPERVQDAMAKSRVAYQEELNYITRSHPELSAAGRNSLALAAVADRTLVTNSGPLVIPRLLPGQSMQSFFGVPDNVRPDVIAATLNELHPPASGNRTIYTVNGQAQLQWEERNKDDAFVRGGTMDPRQLAPAVQDRFDKTTEDFQATDGRGVSVKGPSGLAVQFNGNNTAGVPNKDMLDFRKTLVQHEDVRDTPYTDASGKVVNGKPVQTVGVGVSSHNPHFPPVGPDGKVAPADINASFIRASNDAAVAAKGGQERLGLPNSSAFQLLAEMSYQGGGSFYNVPANKPYVDALKNHDVNAAVAALKQTVPYQMSGSDRQKFYEDMTYKALGATPNGPQYGKREDGSEKGRGFFGEVKRPDGNISTEISIGVEIGGKEVEIPSMVPGLTKAEMNSLLSGAKPSKAIVDKAVAHAKKRMAQGKSPFAGPGEDTNAVPS